MTPERRRPARRLILAVLVATLALYGASPVANAWTLDWILGFHVENSDNIRRDRFDERSDTVFAPRADFALRKDGEWLDVLAFGVGEYRDYQGNTFIDEFRPELAASATFRVVPDRLYFVVADYLSQEPIVFAGIDRPDNVQTVQVFVAGPDLRIDIAEDKLVAELRYIESSAEVTSIFDGHRPFGALRYVHDAGRRTKLSAHLEAEDVRYDASDLNEFFRYDLYGRYQRARKRFAVTADLGYSRIDFGQDGGISAPYAHGTLRWRPSRASRIEAGVSHRYTDATEEIMSSIPPTSLAPRQPYRGPQRTTVGPDLYEERRAEGAYRRRGERMGFRIGAFFRDQEYPNLDVLDVRSRGGLVAVDYRVAEGHALSAFVGTERRDFRTRDRVDEDRVVGGRWRWRWGEHLTLGAEVAHVTRDSSNEADSFDENRVVLSISYSKLPR